MTESPEVKTKGMSLENAEKEVDKFLAFYRIKISKIRVKANREAMEACRDYLTGYVEDGVLNFVDKDGSLECVHNVMRPRKNFPSQVIYREVDGVAKTAMDDDDPSYARIYSLMGALSGLRRDQIMLMRGCDSSLVETLGKVFLQA